MRMLLCVPVLLLATVALAADSTTAPAKPEKVNTHESGVYTFGPWHYEYTVNALGSKSERRNGVLSYEGKTLADSFAKEMDRLDRPWGMMQYFGERRYYDAGWLLVQTYDHPIDPQQGRLLNSPATRPTSQPTTQAAARGEKLRAGIKSFRLSLGYVSDKPGTISPFGKPYYSLVLSVEPAKQVSPFALHVQITEQQAEMLIRHLAIEGFLDRAIAPGDRATQTGPAYTLWLVERAEPDAHDPPLLGSDGSISLIEKIGWGPVLIHRLEGLRENLDGDATKAMDRLLGRLAEPTPAPATTQAAAGSKVRIVRMKDSVQITVTGTAFPVLNAMPVLSIGQQKTHISRYPPSGDLGTLVFTMPAADFDKTKDGDSISVRYEPGGGFLGGAFGTLDKSKVEQQP